MTDPVVYENHDNIATLAANNPPVNALGHAVRAGLLAGIERAEAEGAKAVLIYTFGSLLVWKAGDNSLQAVRDLISTQSGCAVTLLDDLLVCRAVASQTSEIRSFFEAVRKLVRQDLIGLEHCTPRIWAT